MGMILTSECEFCKFGIIRDNDKARVKVLCTYKGKEYYYGQCIPCDNKQRRVIEDGQSTDSKI